MQKSHWVQFSWNLDSLPAQPPKLDKRYEIGTATEDDDRDLLTAALTRSYSMDQSWSTEMKNRLELIQQLIDQNYGSKDMDFVVIRHGNRIIAAAAVESEANAPSNLPLGVCVLSEYRSRGIGAALLFECLRSLKDKGLKKAQVVTLKGVTAERFLYTKFGGVRQTVPAEVA